MQFYLYSLYLQGDQMTFTFLQNKIKSNALCHKKFTIISASWTGNSYDRLRQKFKQMILMGFFYIKTDA